MTDWQFLKIQAAYNLKKLKRLFKKVFKNKGLDIIINCNMKIVNYLDVALNLKMDPTVLLKSLMMKQIIYI